MATTVHIQCILNNIRRQTGTYIYVRGFLKQVSGVRLHILLLFFYSGIILYNYANCIHIYIFLGYFPVRLVVF